MAILAALALFLSNGQPSVAQDQVTVKVRVTVGTDGAPVPNDFEATVTQVDPDGSERAKSSTTVPADGEATVTFTDLEGAIYVASVTYDDVAYRTAAQLEGSALIAAITVYETTIDPSVISVVLDTLTVVRGTEDTLEVFQLMRIENQSDRTFVGEDDSDRRSVLRLSVPQGAYDFLRGQGLVGELSRSGADAVTSDPVLPGTSNINFLYKVNVPRTGWNLSKEVIYPTEIFDILIGQGLSLTGPGFAFEETVDLESQNYRRFRAAGARPGATVIANISFEASSAGLAPVLIGGVLALIIIATSVPLFLRRRSRGPGAIDREQLVTYIASLDESFERGEIDEKAYLSKRHSAKKRLSQLTKEISSR